MSEKLKIGIIGAGIGGLTSAIALQQKGFSVVVYEQASQLGEVGAGITITENASRVFNALGLGEQLAALDDPTPHLGALDYKTGERLSYELRDNIDSQTSHGAVTRQVHRADLHAVLVNAFDRKNGSLHLNHKLTHIEQDQNQVSVQFENGNTDHCDILVACDGLKSIVREQVFSPQPAQFTGFVAWRGLVDRHLIPDIDLNPHFGTFSAENKMFARYPVRHGTLVNYVAIARKPDFKSESWNESAEVSEVVAEFNGWHEDVVNTILATPADRCMRWALYSRQPLDNWSNGRICLLGDAAHPMTPFYGMGAAMAIEDACVLARCCEAEKHNVQGALQRYENARLIRGNNMQQISLNRAEVYMSGDPSSRAQPATAGLGKIMEYDPLTVSI